MDIVQKKYLIIGGSAAGMAAAQAIRQIDATGSLTILSAEPDAPYFRPMIPFLISGQKRIKDLALQGSGFYTAQDIEVRLNKRVVAVDTNRQEVFLESGESLAYGKLLIATGSRPIMPDQIGDNAVNGAFSLRTLANARAILQRATSAQKVVMLGGGLLNLKTAFALLTLGLDVTIVELENAVLPRLMEADAAALIHETLTKAGLKIITGSTAQQILTNSNGVSGVMLDNGNELACHMLCIGIGVQPNIEFLKTSKIELDQGVTVDQHTASSAPNIFAAGDVAVTYNPISKSRVITGLWTNAVEMGRCAGFNMTGHQVHYSGTLGIMNATQVADTPFVTMGIVHTAATEYETHITREAGLYRKLVFSPDGSRLVGAVLVGDISRAGLYRHVIREQMPVEKIKSAMISHQLHYGHFIAS